MTSLVNKDQSVVHFEHVLVLESRLLYIRVAAGSHREEEGKQIEGRLKNPGGGEVRE